MPTETPTWEGTRPVVTVPTWDNTRAAGGVPTWDETQPVGEVSPRKAALLQQQEELRAEGRGIDLARLGIGAAETGAQVLAQSNPVVLGDNLLRAFTHLPGVPERYQLPAVTGNDPILPYTPPTREESLDGLRQLLGLTGWPAEVMTGLGQAGHGLAAFFNTRNAIGTLGAGAAPRAFGGALQAGFAADMASHVPEAVQAAQEAFDPTNGAPLSEKVRTAAELVAGVAMPAAIVKHAAFPKEPVSLHDQFQADRLRADVEQQALTGADPSQTPTVTVGDVPGGSRRWTPVDEARRAVAVAEENLANARAAARAVEVQSSKSKVQGSPPEEAAGTGGPQVPYERGPVRQRQELTAMPDLVEKYPAAAEELAKEEAAATEETSGVGAAQHAERRQRAVQKAEKAIAELRKERDGLLRVWDVPASEGEDGMGAHIMVSHPNVEHDYTVYEQDGKWIAESSSGTRMTMGREAGKAEAIAAAKQEVLEQAGEQRGTFGNDLDASYELDPIFATFRPPDGVTTVSGWTRTKWGSWYATVEGTDSWGEPKLLKLSIRDHEPVRKDMGIPDVWQEVSKDWTPGEVARALDKIEAKLARRLNATGGPEAASAGIKTPLEASAADKSNVSALRTEAESALTSGSKAGASETVNQKPTPAPADEAAGPTQPGAATKETAAPRVPLNNGEFVLNGQPVQGIYMAGTAHETPFTGQITEVHIDTSLGANGRRTATITLDTPVEVFGSKREQLLIGLDKSNRVTDSKYRAKEEQTNPEPPTQNSQPSAEPPAPAPADEAAGPTAERPAWGNQLAAEREEIQRGWGIPEVKARLLKAVDAKQKAIESAKGGRFVAYKAEEGSLGWRIADAKTGRGDIVGPDVEIDHPDLGRTVIRGGLRYKSKAEANAAAQRLESLNQRSKPPTPAPADEAAGPTASTTALDPAHVRTVELPVDQIKLSKDVPNFKGGADEGTGTVTGQELAGKYERTGTAPVVVWQRLNGDHEIITGRHRLELARRTGERTIPAQIVREADGFTKAQALTFDAEANIRDGQGEVSDYATYFKGTDISEAEARARGLLSRAKGKAGWSLAKSATDDVHALWRAGRLTDAQAVAIANAAPGDAGAQQIGSKFALQGKPPDFLTNVIQASKAEAGTRAQTLDLFGADDSAMRTMAEQAERAAGLQREIAEQIRAVSGAAKRPEVARKLGVDVQDPAGIVRRIGELKAELARWENWPLQPDLVAKVKGGPPAEVPSSKSKVQGEGKAEFTLAPAESVAEQQARMDAADAAKARQAERDKLADRQAAPLKGTAGDLGQGDLLGGPTDLFAPPGPKPAGREIIGMGGAKVAAEGGGRSLGSARATPANPVGPSRPAPRTAALSAPPPIAAAPAPALGAIATNWNHWTLGIRRQVHPVSIDAPARQVADMMRHFLGEKANAAARAAEAMAAYRAEFDKTPVPHNWTHDPAAPLPYNYEIIDAFERNRKSLPARYQQLAALFDREFAWRIEAIQQFAPGALRHLIDQYFPHIWTDPQRAGDVMAQLSSRLFAGRKEFLKQRTLPTFVEGLERGLKPISDNPVDLLLAKMHSMDRFLVALKAQAEMRGNGTMRFKYFFEKMPEGFERFDDPSFIVQRPPEVTVDEAHDHFQRQKLGDLLNHLGVGYERVARLTGRWGEAQDNPAEIFARVGTAEPTLWHELGHQLDFKFPDLRRRFPTRGNSPLAVELRKLADLRAEGTNVSESYRKYLRKTEEKMAELTRAYVHAPELFRTEAPTVWREFNAWLDDHPDIRAGLDDIRPRLRTGSEQTTIKLGGMQVLGHWVMPSGAAQILRNYTSPGLAMNPIYNAVRVGSNILNSAQLGLSAFHLGFTSLDAAASRMAVAIEDVMRHGRPGRAAMTLASVPFAPVTNIRLGGRVRNEVLHPGTESAEIAGIVRMLEAAGGRVGQDHIYMTDFTRRMKRAFHEAKDAWFIGDVPASARAAWNAPWAAIEQMMRPIMEYVVPRQKLGVFADLARREMERLGPNATVEQTRAAMRAAWDSVDNRLGQVVYDNLFYNRAAKDVALIAFRAYGWQLGKYREGFGALTDTGRYLADKARGRDAEFTHRMAYVPALLLVVGTLGGVTHRMMTGQDPEGQDWFMPKTGEMDKNGLPVRLNFPSYLKDVFAYAKHPVTSFGHSLNPMFSALFDLLSNKDFYDVQIRNEDDPISKQAASVLGFGLKTMTPFAVSGALKLREDDAPLWKQVAPFFGITPAPARFSMTPAQELAADLTAAAMPKGVRTQEQFDRSKALKDVVQQIRKEGPQAAAETLRGGLQAGTLTPHTVQTLIEKANYTPLQFQVHHMEATAAMRVWRVASPPERETLRNIIGVKVMGAQALPMDRRMQFLRELGFQPGAKPGP